MSETSSPASRPADPERQARHDRVVRRTLNGAWVCVALSAIFLWLSKVGEAGGGDVLWAMSLMLARLFGMTSFALGGVALYNHKWNEGIALLLISVVLPVIAFVVHGTI